MGKERASPGRRAIAAGPPGDGRRGFGSCDGRGGLPAAAERSRQEGDGDIPHRAGVVLDLSVEGEGKPIGVTPTHLVWSTDRQHWVSVGEMRLGERMAAKNGSTPCVLSLKQREHPEEVFNIEVDGDHVYRVGEQGLLVHNASVCPQQPNITDGSNEFFSRAYDYRKANSLLRPESAFYKNIAILKYNDGSGSKYEPFPNTSLLHSEGSLATWLKSKGFGMPGNTIVIEAIFSERQPCSNCQDVIKELCRMNCCPVRCVFPDQLPDSKG